MRMPNLRVCKAMKSRCQTESDGLAAVERVDFASTVPPQREEFHDRSAANVSKSKLSRRSRQSTAEPGVKKLTPLF